MKLPRHLFIGVFIVVFCWLLGGCSSTFEQNEKIVGPSLSVAQRNAQRNQLIDVENYVTRGSIELDLIPQGKYGNASTNTRGSAKYVYDRKPNSYVFAVTHFVAGVLLKVKSNPKIGGIELTTSDGNKYNFASETDFIKAIHIPVTRLPYWMMGINLGDETDVIFDDQGHLQAMSLQGWNIRYYEYDTFENYVLPKRLVLKNSSVGTIRIIVDSWEF